MNCKTDKPGRHKDGSGHHDPVRIFHCREHRLFPPSDNLDALFERRLEDHLQLRIMQDFIGRTEFPVYAPFSTGHWPRQVPLFHNVSNAIGPPATAHPFGYFLSWTIGSIPLRLQFQARRAVFFAPVSSHEV